MSKFFTKKWSKGFTLIELLVVIAIIGVLASIVLASLNNARRKSRDARRITDIKQIQLALELYLDGFGAGQYPTAAGGTCGNPPVIANATESEGLQALAIQGYIPQIPRDPSNIATCYEYASATNASMLITMYHLGATLEDSTNTALNGDKDCNSTGAASPPCPSGFAWTNGFDGTVATRYDVTP